MVGPKLTNYPGWECQLGGFNFVGSLKGMHLLPNVIGGCEDLGDVGRAACTSKL